MLALLAVVEVLAAPCTAQASGQRSPLRVSGTMSINYTYGWVPPRPDGWPSDVRFLGTRFGGRIAVALNRKIRVGFAVASWEVADVQGTSCTGGAMCEKLLAFHGSAIATTGYVQWQVGSAVIRGAMGLVRSIRQLPGDVNQATAGLIRRRAADRFGVGAGGGINVRIGSYIYLAPSVDLVWMPTVSSASQELRWAVLWGVGITVQ